jgi:hypothetical protein
MEKHHLDWLFGDFLALVLLIIKQGAYNPPVIAGHPFGTTRAAWQRSGWGYQDEKESIKKW